MSLATYKKKRKFNNTPEPGGTKENSKSKNSFVIQRHDATRLHYDFRLEVNGVLKSWAVPKGPSLNPTDKRLSVMVEDHPLAYGKFSGKIPDGNYGAGLVEIWDHGIWVPEEMEKVSDKEIEKHIKKGMLKFSLKGRKLKGSFALVRIKGSESKNWLLIKHRDKYATDKAYSSEDETTKSSPINKSRIAEGKEVSTKVIPASKQKAAKKSATKSVNKAATKSVKKAATKSVQKTPKKSTAKTVKKTVQKTTTDSTKQPMKKTAGKTAPKAVKKK